MFPLSKNKKIFIATLTVFLVLGFIFTASVKMGLAGNLTPAQIEQYKKDGYSEAFINQVDTQPLNAPVQPTKLNAQVQAAGGQNYNKDDTSWVSWIVAFLLYLLMVLMNKFVVWGAGLVQYVIQFMQNVSLTHASVVLVGWGVTRGLVNLFFALILLIMSFATVLQIESFGMKRMLKNLVIAALLINFSLVFAGIILDFTQVLTNYFISAASGTNGANLSQNLMNGLKINLIYKVSPDDSVITQAKDAASGATIATITGLTMGILLFLGAAVSFIAFAFFLVVRIVWIWILLIGAPLAWLSFAAGSLPEIGGLWNEWWKKFLKWAFFAPAYSFFIYLALVIAQNGLGDKVNKIAVNPDLPKAFPSAFFDTPAIFLQYLVIIMIMLYGLEFAKKSSVAGAGFFYGLAQKAGKGAVGLAGGLAGSSTAWKRTCLTAWAPMPKAPAAPRPVKAALTRSKCAMASRTSPRWRCATPRSVRAASRSGRTSTIGNNPLTASFTQPRARLRPASWRVRSG